MKHIYLKQDNVGDAIFYVVKRLTNDVRYTIGERLTRATVRDLCDSPGMWTVHVEGYGGNS